MEDKRERFVRLAEKRVNNAIRQIELIGNLSNKNNYSYTEQDVKKIIKSLKSSLSKIKNKFNLDGETKFEL